MVETTSSLIQKAQVFDRHPTMLLTEACSIGAGILRLTETQHDMALQAFREIQEKVALFVPASGSGSRMFDELYRFSVSGEPNEGSVRFFESFPSLAIYAALSAEQKELLAGLSEQEIAKFVLLPTGLNLLRRPKGLIPFHQANGHILNAFHEHVLQFSQLVDTVPMIHFTLQDGFQDEVRASIMELSEIESLDLSFSIQNRNTDAFCFDENQQLVVEDGIPLRRPAGHGSLLENLNDIDADLILIKNIDNIQHISRAEASNRTWKILMGTLQQFFVELGELRSNYSEEAFHALNAKYEFLPNDLELSEALMEELIARPTRICGMVKNDGAPGGGPFWIEKDGERTKQIVEKVQISMDADQQAILEGSSHFNPVMIVAAKNDLDGNRLDLHAFANDEQYLVVKRPQDGKSIFYRELPGLWNGAMYYWNTIFVEIPSEVFSPVKAVLDLNAQEHLSAE